MEQSSTLGKRLMYSSPGRGKSREQVQPRIRVSQNQAHPGVSRQERKSLCRLIDNQKLSPEASIHAAQNERFPVRAVIQVLFSEHTKLNRHLDWSGSFSGTRSPNTAFEPPVRCPSKHELTTQQVEIRKLREDILSASEPVHVHAGTNR
ncbi:hypothetical protein HHK36_014014 [Tetracentron sinense]|uniref:NPH3 domain-containing protein n=1 Tax=Tetracentron sinense TaxID=13715 RepID=A0A835DHW5_TETSI|nr:hypothetical protein HHK36_014014 [Tetracentron sinense]